MRALNHCWNCAKIFLSHRISVFIHKPSIHWAERFDNFRGNRRLPVPHLCSRPWVRHNKEASLRGYWNETLQWRHNELDGVSNHRGLHCLLNHLFRRRSKKTSKLHVTGLCAQNSPHKGPVKRKNLYFIMKTLHTGIYISIILHRIITRCCRPVRYDVTGYRWQFAVFSHSLRPCECT